jgi:hypothetical protein
MVMQVNRELLRMCSWQVVFLSGPAAPADEQVTRARCPSRQSWSNATGSRSACSRFVEHVEHFQEGHLGAKYPSPLYPQFLPSVARAATRSGSGSIGLALGIEPLRFFFFLINN